MKNTILVIMVVLLLAPLASAYVDIDNTQGDQYWLSIQSNDQFRQEFISYYDGLSGISEIEMKRDGLLPCNIIVSIQEGNTIIYREEIGDIPIGQQKMINMSFAPYASKGKKITLIIEDRSNNNATFYMDNYTYVIKKRQTGCFLAANTKQNPELPPDGSNFMFQSRTEKKNIFFKLLNVESKQKKALRMMLGSKATIKMNMPIILLWILMFGVTFFFLNKKSADRNIRKEKVILYLFLACLLFFLSCAFIIYQTSVGLALLLIIIYICYKKKTGSTSIILFAMVLMALCAFLMINEYDKYAEQVAIMAYFALGSGAVLQLLEIKHKPKELLNFKETKFFAVYFLLLLVLFLKPFNRENYLPELMVLFLGSALLLNNHFRFLSADGDH